jgi:GNAT superfamily N-acetyltransferase
MNQTEFEDYLEVSVPYYAEEHVRAGGWNAEKAKQRAKENFHKLLPDGLDTKNHHLLAIEDESIGRKVGILWFAVEERETGPLAFVYDIRIDEVHRRRGYGRQAFEALEEKVREMGLTRIMLHVFGHNFAARSMYQKLGYEAVNVMMSKTLSS